jgi:hypothetical protein
MICSETIYGLPKTYTKKNSLKIFTNPDDKTINEWHLARCIYAETMAESLSSVEQLCVMVRNTGIDISELVNDETVFESLNKKSTRHKYLFVKYDEQKLQMCLRVVKNMKSIPDKIFGATRFHRSDVLPEWATSIGSIAEIDGLSFYRGDR